MAKTLVNTPTHRDVDAFLDAVTPQQRKEDAKKLLAIMRELTGREPKIWGNGIVAFGRYTYQRKGGKDQYEWFTVGFSPGKAHLSIYLMFDLRTEPLLDKLGPHKNGAGCLYIKRIDDVDLAVLKKLIKKSDRWR